MNDSTAFIQYFVSDTVIYSITITKNDVQSEAIRYDSDDLSDFKNLIRLSKDETLYKTIKKDTFLNINHKLSQLLWRQNNPNINRFIISPDSWLNYLNFEMLLNPSNKDNNEFLIEKKYI